MITEKVKFKYYYNAIFKSRYDEKYQNDILNLKNYSYVTRMITFL